MPRSDRSRLLAIGLIATVALTACTREQAAPQATASAATPSRLATLSTSDLHNEARAAFAANRLYAPAGQNAAEYLLVLRDRGLANDADRGALAELEPYLVIAVEQAVDRGDEAEARRIHALLQRANSSAPALQRLAIAIDQVHAKKLAEAQSAAAAMTAATTPTPPATPARAAPIIASESPAKPIVADVSASAPTSRAVTASTESPAVTPSPVATPAASPPTPPTADHAPAAVAAPALATSPPKLLRDVAPNYPRDALARGIEGEVDVRFTIDSDGHVHDARAVASTPNNVFDRAAVTAASRWVFEAGHAPVTTTRRLTFRLPEG